MSISPCWKAVTRKMYKKKRFYQQEKDENKY